MYHGQNRNNSVIDKANVDRAIPSIYNIPLVGEFMESESDAEESNFGSHGGKIVIDDNGMKFIHTTKPIGVVPESANVYWEKVIDEKELEKEYLVIDGALVWNRYETEVETLKTANFGQSMEVEVEDGWFDSEDGNYHITDFSFSALCILGIDGKKNGRVEPAFEGSKIITYSKEIMLNEMKEMKEELKEFYTSYAIRKEEKELDKEKSNEVEDKESVKKQEVDKEATKENTEDKSEDKGSEGEPKVIQTETEGRSGNVIETKEEAKEQEGTSGDVAGTAGTTDAGGDARAIADAHTENTGVANADAPTPSAREIADANTETDFAVKYEELKSKLESNRKELEELREFKKEVDKEKHEQGAIELFNKMGLSEEDVKGLDIYEFNLDELTERCYSILGRKAVENKAEFSLDGDKEEVKKSNKVELSQASKEKTNSAYGKLFSKYSKK